MTRSPNFASLVVVLAVTSLKLATPSHAAPSALRGLGLDESLRDPPRLAPALASLGPLPHDLPVIVRVAVERSALQPSPGQLELEALVERVGLYHRLGVHVVLDMGAVPRDQPNFDGWKALMRAVALRCRGRVRAYQLAVRGDGKLPEVAHAVRLAAVEVRATDPAALVILDGLAGLPAAARESLFSESLAPYVDALAVPFAAPAESSALSSKQILEELIAAVDPDASLVVGGVPLGADPAAAVQAFLRWEFSQLGTPVVLATYEAGPDALVRVLRAASSLADAIYGEVVTLDTAASELALSDPGGETATMGSLRSRLLYNTRRFATYLAYWTDGGSPSSLRLTLKEPSGRPPMVRDAATGSVNKAQDFSWDAASNRAAMTVPLTATPLLLDFNYSGSEVQAARVDVSERILPTIGEVIYRHQQVQAAQDTVLVNYIANVTMEQHFRASSTDSGWDVATENLLYADRQGVEWEETSFTLNGSKWGPDRPPFPLLQPEKVLSLPLDLRLNADYTYRLDGTAVEAHRECYVVHFTPVSDDKPLYRGTVWIDSETFQKLKLQAVQTRPGSPVQSNEEIHTFAVAGSAGGRSIHLLKRLTSRQIILIGGRNILLEREVRFDRYAINPPSFLARREASRRGENVMYRDTDDGLRYLVKRGGERVVADRTSSAKALAFGTVLDPSYEYPLPILGLNYLDFDFIGKDSQLALLFGGVLALVNVQRPRLVGQKVDGSLDLFAIAVSSRDEVFKADEPLDDEQLQTRPFSTGLNLGYQFTDFQKIAASYQLRYDSYKANHHTAPDFTVPESTFTNGVGLTYEYRRGGYTLQASGALYRRVNWRPWGREGDYDPAHQDYVKYGASLSKDFFSGIHKFRLNLAYFGGHDLDRFSMYQFGLFDETRIHGVPTARVRFPELAMLRASYSLNLLDLYRLDIFVDQAMGRDPYDASEWHGITGLGLGFNLRGPFRTLVRGEIGKSFLPSVYEGAGSYSAQLTFFKPI